MREPIRHLAGLCPSPGCQRFRENVGDFVTVLSAGTLETLQCQVLLLGPLVPPNPNSAAKQGPCSRDCFMSALCLRETSVSVCGRDSGAPGMGFLNQLV